MESALAGPGETGRSAGVSDAGVFTATSSRKSRPRIITSQSQARANCDKNTIAIKATQKAKMSFSQELASCRPASINELSPVFMRFSSIERTNGRKIAATKISTRPPSFLDFLTGIKAPYRRLSKGAFSVFQYCGIPIISHNLCISCLFILAPRSHCH